MTREWLNQGVGDLPGRVLWVGDGQKSYRTPLADGESYIDALDDFAAGYDAAPGVTEITVRWAVCRDGVEQASGETTLNLPTRKGAKTVKTIRIDRENNGDAFWAHLTGYDVIHMAHVSDEARAAAARLCEQGVNEVEVSDEVAAELAGWFATMPGWTGGPEYAPHPLTIGG